jgi:hypothetical protein
LLLRHKVIRSASAILRAISSCTCEDVLHLAVVALRPGGKSVCVSTSWALMRRRLPARELPADIGRPQLLADLRGGHLLVMIGSTVGREMFSPRIFEAR